jgi:hypothetical protein
MASFTHKDIMSDNDFCDKLPKHVEIATENELASA